MTSSLLLLAQVTAAAAPEHAASGFTGQVQQIAGQFGIKGPLLLAQIVNFAIVAFLLWRFAFKPVMATIAERQQKIAAGLKYAEEMKAKLDAAQQTSEAQIREAQLKGQQLIAEAQKSAKAFLEKQQQEAVEQSNALIGKARSAIELEKQKMLAEARTEIARLVVATTQRVLAKDLSDFERTRYNESAARELSQL
jgi:F-type H+-transporting ATPase subunit b